MPKQEGIIFLEETDPAGLPQNYGYVDKATDKDKKL